MHYSYTNAFIHGTFFSFKANPRAYLASDHCKTTFVAKKNACILRTIPSIMHIIIVNYSTEVVNGPAILWCSSGLLAFILLRQLNCA